MIVPASPAVFKDEEGLGVAQVNLGSLKAVGRVYPRSDLVPGSLKKLLYGAVAVIKSVVQIKNKCFHLCPQLSTIFTGSMTLPGISLQMTSRYT